MPQDARHGGRESCGSSARTSKEVVLESVPALLGLFTFDDQKCSRFQRAHMPGKGRVVDHFARIVDHFFQ